MVARDGIEPPTPAFSGPRSTTELPGLSADLRCISCAGFRMGTGAGGTSSNSSLQQLSQVYQSARAQPTGRKRGPKLHYCLTPLGACPTLLGNHAEPPLASYLRHAPAKLRRTYAGMRPRTSCCSHSSCRACRRLSTRIRGRSPRRPRLRRSHAAGTARRLCVSASIPQRR